MADKRIRDLTQQNDPLLSDFLPIDRPGWSEAMRISLQDVINMASESAPFSVAYSGSTNPDSAFGSNGDLYFTIPADQSSLKLSQKIADEWGVVFELTLSTTALLSFDESNLVLVYEGNYSLSFNLPDGKSIASIERLQDGVITRPVSITQAVTTVANNPNTVIEGFDNNSAQTITIKLI